MRSERIALIAVLAALLVVFAGCTGFSGDAEPTTENRTMAPTTDATDGPTTELTTESTTDVSGADTTEPHTARGTSHTGTHLVVSDSTSTENVSVTLVGADNETHRLAGGSIDLTREIHERGHGVRAVVERGNETVFDEVVRGYEYYDVTVYDNETSVSYTVV